MPDDQTHRYGIITPGTRDGALAVVSADLGRCRPVPEIAPTLQRALDDWAGTAHLLRAAAAAWLAELEREVPQSAAAAPVMTASGKWSWRACHARIAITAPIAPRPRTAVPLEMTATRLPFAV